MGIFACPLVKAHQLQLRIHLGFTFRLRHPRQLQPKTNIFSNGAPWQQSELLKHHGHLALADMAQCGLITGHDVDHLVAVTHEN